MSSISHTIHKPVNSKPSFDKANTRNIKKMEPEPSTIGHRGQASERPSIAEHSGLTPEEHAQSKERFKWMHNAALVQHSEVSHAAISITEVSLRQPIESHTLKFQNQLSTLAANKTQFNQLMRSAFGEDTSAEKIEALRSRVLADDFSWLPQAQYVDSETLQGADGAYAASSNTIYLNSNSTDVGTDYMVYVEELGHSIDQLLNDKDATGDEGILFSLYLAGAPVSESDRAMLKSENDGGTIIVDGEVVDVEFSMLSDEIGRFGDRLKEWWDKARELVRRAETAFAGFVDGVNEIVTSIIKRPFDVLSVLGDGLSRAMGLVIQGDFGQAIAVIRDTLVSSGKLALNLIPEVVAMSFSAIVMAADRLRGAITERPLNAEEMSYLQNIFGDSIDYSSVTIVSGGTKDQWNMDAHVVGNEIFMPNTLSDGTPMFDADGALTEGGLALLGHEVAHVWQFQNFGTEYIGESLIAQFYDGDNDTYDWHHKVVAGTAFEDMGPEHQAEIAGLIGEAIHHRVENGEHPTLTLDALNAVINNYMIVITPDQFEIFLAANEVLNPDAPRWTPITPKELAALREIKLQNVVPSI